MHATLLVLVAAASLMAESSATVGKELRAVEVYENILKNLSPSELTVYGPSLESRIKMLKRFAWPHSSPLGNEMEHIKSILFSNASTCAEPVAIFIGGGSGSGKSSLNDTWTTKMNMSCGYTFIDPDEIMMEMPEWGQLENGDDICAAVELHTNASTIAKSVFADAIAKKYNVVYDGTMRNLDESTGRLEMATQNGYQVYFFGAWADTALAAERALERANKTGRYVSLCVIVETHVNFANNFMEYSRLMPENQLYDTSNKSSLSLIFNNSIVVDTTRFQQFLAEANDTLEEVKGKLSITTLDAYENFHKACNVCGFPQTPVSSSPPSLQPTTTAHISTSSSSTYILRPAKRIIALAIGLVICVIL
uniref:Zeta toxin domain-containing protein n=1 Tax=Plectus sambesii TaxID=2011161 RepID=A0A914W317_9BILA